MALDATAREANILDSIKKFLVDTFETTKKVEIVTFDTFIDMPDMQNKRPPLRWISFNLGPIDIGFLSEIALELYLCTQEDPEGFRLAQLRDNVFEQLNDPDQTDGMKRIPFYKSYLDRAWEQIGSFLVQNVIEGPRETASDQTKYKQLTVLLKVASKV